MELKVEILVTVKQDQFIRAVGSDISIGEKVLGKGQVISPIGGELGALASIGVQQIQVYKKPIVSVLSTGNELVEVTEPGPLKYGTIRDSNRPTLKSTLEQLGYQVIDLGIASDEY
jgi:gephyrin